MKRVRNAFDLMRDELTKGLVEEYEKKERGGNAVEQRRAAHAERDRIIAEKGERLIHSRRTKDDIY